MNKRYITCFLATTTFGAPLLADLCQPRPPVPHTAYSRHTALRPQLPVNRDLSSPNSHPTEFEDYKTVPDPIVPAALNRRVQQAQVMLKSDEDVDRAELRDIINQLQRFGLPAEKLRQLD